VLVLICGGAGGGAGGVGRGGVLWQAASRVTSAAAATAPAAFLQSAHRCDLSALRPVSRPAVHPVWLILLEALLALALVVFIVWWTMFHGRKPPKK
jgi:hypothetical protein